VQHKLIAESLHDGYQNEQLNVIELQHQVNEYEAMIDYLYEEMDKREHDFDSIVKYIDHFYIEESYNSKPRVIRKHYVPNHDGKGESHSYYSCCTYIWHLNCNLFCVGKNVEWLPYIDKLILEMLANMMPPTCVQANLYAMAKVIMPNHEVVKELPSPCYIGNSRTMLSLKL
jgi:hypothetical protein